MRATIDWWMDGGVYTFVCEAQDVFLAKQSFLYQGEHEAPPENHQNQNIC